MACWVAPILAAELWNCSVEHVMSGIYNGSLTTRMEGPFLLVRVLDEGGPSASATISSPATNAITATSSSAPAQAVVQSIGIIEESGTTRMDSKQLLANQPPQDDIIESVEIRQWREARDRVASRRRPPAIPNLDAA